uniref:DUF3715 domain-containing protein n=1 Tax=Sander lucioperca TaxID=283035 RepID=A0A8C9ZFP0_SANLU
REKQTHRKSVLVPVSESSGVFQNNILAPLKSAYLYEESKQSFRYTSAVLVNNPALEEKYCAFRAKRKEEGYSEEDLKESYGFLLFDDVNKANALGETGVLTGNSTCTTLGDPSKGVYIPMYSDCLDLNRWYHGKSGYIAIIRLTKGRVKKVLENYTQNLTAPTVGFDCHVSEQLPSVSAKTSSFLAFERTQYYMYELLDDGSNVTTQSPSAARPIAIVSFSYTDTKASIVASQEKRFFCHYFPWRGQLQIGTLFYDVGLRSTVALIPAELPPVVKIGRAISMSDLRQLLPRAVFETCFSGEVFLDGLYFSLYELVSSEAEDTNSLPLLLREIKEKDLALTIQLNDGGFLILLHSSHIQYLCVFSDTGSSATDVLQGMFVFPVSQVIQTDTKSGAKKPAISSEILQVLQVLNYAEGEVEKTPIDPSEELCEVLAQHMQRYAALINPGLALSPARELSIFPDQYDVPDAHKHLYSCPELTNRAWQSFRSYLSKPVSFQLPLSKASEILAPRQEERIEDLDDDVYICLSSPEEAPANPVSMESEDQLTGQRSPVNIETPVDSCITSAAAQVDVTAVPQNVVPDGLHAGDATKYTGKSDLTVLIKTDDMGAKNVPPSTSDDLPAELIVSITSAERTVTDESLGMISTVSATMHNDIQLSGFSAKLQMTGVNSLNDETVTTKKVLDCPEFTNLTKTQKRKLRRGRYKGRKRVSKACVETPSLQIPVEDDNLMSQTEDQAKESSGHPQLSNPSCIEQRKVQRRKCKFRKPSSSVDLAVAEENKVDPGQQSVESTFLMELEAFPLRKKTERWDLKPVISECGRILVPHGSLDIADQIKSLKDKIQSTKDEQTLVDASVNDTVEMEQESKATTSKDGGNHFQIVVSDVNPEHNILRPSDDGNGLLTLNQESTEQSSKTDGTATSPSEAVKENHTNTLSPEKIATKGDLLLSKLKSVLLRGKRKMDFLVSKEMTADTAQYTEPHLKKGKVDSDTGMLKSNYTITSVQDTDVRVKEVSKMLSVDPLFAYALGLTPKETPDKIQKTEGQDTQQRKDSSETQEQTILDKQPQIIHRKTVKEKMNSACSSTDALNLLADLALSASNDQVPPQPDPALERKPETSLKKCDLTKDVTTAEQESVLHALLRQPAARSMQPIESPSPSHLMGGSELVGLVSKEHAYSLPPSSSLLLGLPGTPFQVSPLSGSTRLLHHHQTMYGDGIKTLHPSVSQTDRSEKNHRTPEYLKKHMVCRRKFRHSRTFVDKDGSIQVTKQWKENYDFNLDSKFTNDSKDRTIVRALHGPWDFSMQDTSEEVRLIVHMWIGLFYSRSTARFFHVDSYPCSEESDSLEMPSGMVSTLAQSELKAYSFAPFLSVTDTSDPSISKALDLTGSLEHTDGPSCKGDETFIVVQKEMESVSVQPENNLTASGIGHVLHGCNNEKTDMKVCIGNKRKKAGSLAHTDVPSCKDDETLIVVQKEMESVSVRPENQITSGIGHVLHGCNNEKTDMKDAIKKSEATAMNLVQKHGKDSSKSVTVVEVDSNKEAGNVVLTVKHDAIESKDGENLEVKESLYQQGNVEPSPKVILTDDDSTNKESGIVCNGYILENEKQLPGEEPISVSLGKAENVKDVDCCTVYKGKVIEDEDPFGKENGFDEKDSCVSPVEANSELSDQPLPINCDGPDSVKKDCITECNQKPPFDEQPPKDNNEEDACHDLQLRKLCANGSVLTDELAISEKSPHASSEMEPISNEPKNDTCLADKAHQKAALPMSDENNCSLDVSNANGSIPQTNDSVETECQNNVMANFNLISIDHEDGDTHSIEGDQKVVNTTEKELFYHQAHSPQFEAEAALTKETDLKQIEKTNEGLEKISIVGLIPFIGLDTSREDTVQQHDTHSQGKVEEVDEEEIPFISKTTYPETVQPTGLCSTSQMYSKKPELSKITGKIALSLLDVSETNQPVVSGSESDNRCPTPTMDEKPFEYLTCSGPSNTSASAFSGSETSKNMTQKCLSTGSTSRKDEVPHKSTFNSDATPHHDLELRTHRVLQSIDKFLHQTSHTKTSSQIETAEKHSLDQTPNPENKFIPTCFTTSHISSDFKDKKMQCNTTPAVVSASTSPELHTESTSNFLISPFKSKLEEVLGVKLQLKKTNSPVQQQHFERIDKLQETSVGQDCHPYISVPCTESLQAIKPNIDQGRHKTTSQSNLSHDLRSYSQRPVMAVKPSKTDECQADCISKDRQIENAVMSHFSVNKPTETPVVTYTIPTTMFLEKKTESLKENSEELNDDKQDASELSSKSSWLSNVSDSKSNSDKAKCVLQDPLKPHQGRDISKLNNIPLSSFPAQSLESAKKISKLVDGNQGFIKYSLVEKVGQTTKESIEIDQKDCSDASTSHVVYKDGGIIDDSLFLGPQSSLMCTVYNTSRKRSYSFLEQVSQRCLQDDPTEASMEQECLIFSEQMKQLLKRSKRGPICQQGTHDELNLSCTSPVTVHFCSLEEQEDSVDHLNAHFDAPSLVGQKIKVNMSDRKKTTEDDKTHPPNVSRATGNPMEHAGVSAVTSECVTLYEAMMNDVCAVKKVPSRPHKHFRIHRSYPKSEPSNHFDFCDQMKREMDESFRSNLNSVVKKSCKTKYRFYVLLTSDDAFFEETKLEAEGHTAVQPSEFFLGEDSSSSLLIILRNEDIAEHICEIPHLLELKKSPGAQFAGIDEPDDVVNLTHQELFTRGGFVMFDRAALESLSFCKMKKMSEILQERSRTGKWKWMLHYRDSRRLKENARLSAEAKEKKHFLNWCQEAGILEVLPYHECDLMSREQPDYLKCLVRLQVQNISARYPVFITDSAFGKNGILTMTFDSFLTYSPSKPIKA